MTIYCYIKLNITGPASRFTLLYHTDAILVRSNTSQYSSDGMLFRDMKHHCILECQLLMCHNFWSENVAGTVVQTRQLWPPTLQIGDIYFLLLPNRQLYSTLAIDFLTTFYSVTAMHTWKLLATWHDTKMATKMKYVFAPKPATIGWQQCKMPSQYSLPVVMIVALVYIFTVK